MADWRRTAVVTALVAAFSLAVPAGCQRATSSSVNDDILTDLTEELGQRQCQRRLDSLAFSIQGILFQSEVDITDRAAVMALVPATLPVCPVTGDTYTVTDAGMVLVFTCPSGHGSVEVE